MYSICQLSRAISWRPTALGHGPLFYGATVYVCFDRKILEVGQSTAAPFAPALTRAPLFGSASRRSSKLMGFCSKASANSRSIWASWFMLNDPPRTVGGLLVALQFLLQSQVFQIQIVGRCRNCSASRFSRC